MSILLERNDSKLGKEVDKIRKNAAQQNIGKADNAGQKNRYKKCFYDDFFN